MFPVWAGISFWKQLQNPQPQQTGKKQIGASSPCEESEGSGALEN
ncbi:hypothetical protein T07_11894 [Trichinella nelsoni]|uniref:Uncharacterized protein n=1 Tax=Trichinella nelsoni TaxID=6336 RepID=A0A0V0S4J8_9BILA|nr:hypothetical protein T07_11894 [Trichinella nelsoni]KRZ89115.1 hypothetical protein T08_9164 [Trichinella sp. T8]